MRRNTRQDSSEREFERLYLETYDLVYGYVRARMKGSADAEDIVAEAFLKAARSFDSFDPTRARFSTWMVTIAHNCMVSHFRKARATVALEDTPQKACAIEGGQGTVDDLMLAQKLLVCLDDDERAIVLLKYREDMRNVDIARELGMNESTVSTVLRRALAKMRNAAEKDERQPASQAPRPANARRGNRTVPATWTNRLAQPA